jgi:hypothetical protein
VFASFSRNEVAFGSRARRNPDHVDLGQNRIGQVRGNESLKATSIVPSGHEREFGSPPSLR